MHVAAGAAHESKVVFRDEGDHVPGQCLPGNRIVVLQQRPHERFERKGADLILEYSLPLACALAGRHKVCSHAHLARSSYRMARPQRGVAINGCELELWRRRGRRW